VTIIFHPYILRSLQTTLIGILYDLLEENRIYLLTNDEILKYLKLKHSDILNHKNLSIINNNLLHTPVFDVMTLFKQSLNIKRYYLNLYKNLKPDLIILENDCMSFLTMSITSIFIKKELPVYCIQSMNETEITNNISLKNETLNKKIRKLVSLFSSTLILKIIREIYYHFGYIYIHFFLPIISRLPIIYKPISYVKMNCVSGQLFPTFVVVYQKLAYSIYKNSKWVDEKRLFYIEHPIINEKIPINLFTNNKIKLKQNSKDLLLMINPVFFQNDKFDYLGFNKNFLNLIKIMRYDRIFIKPHPDTISLQPILDFFVNNNKNLKIILLNKNLNTYVCLTSFRNILDFPPGQSTTLSTASFISKRYKISKLIFGFTFNNNVELYDTINNTMNTIEYNLFFKILSEFGNEKIDLINENLNIIKIDNLNTFKSIKELFHFNLKQTK